jgi:pimeloyl-ACP methyl ester carboxylesterase
MKKWRLLLLLPAVAALVVVVNGAAAPPPQPTIRPCSPDVGVAGAVCGTVDVPLDRANPAAGTIAIYFELYRHSASSQPSLGTIVPSIGGPGISNTAARGSWLGTLAPLLDRRDLLLIDHRGMGKSQAIDCPGLQHGRGDFPTEARACGAQLGAAADRYGSGDVADDVDAVRMALGIDKIDYWAASYGAVDVRAYGYRHADHLRAAVLDSPYNSVDDTFLRSLPGAAVRIQALVCLRSPRCSSANHAPEATLAWLIRRLRRQPVSGRGYDADGHPHALRVDEKGVLAILYNDYFADPAFLNQGELTAAAQALRLGDRTPLLRLLAESPAPVDYGDPSGFFSVGSTYAAFCSDARLPWDKSAPEATREAQYQGALAALPRDATSPFLPSAWTGFMASQPIVIAPGADACVSWPAPTRPDPPFPANQPFPANVPALLLGGGLDYLDVNAERQLIPRFPHAQFVEVASAGHPAGLWSPCARAIELHFLETLQTGDTSCAADPAGPMHNPFSGATGILQLQGLANFPRVANQAIPARVDLGGHDRTTRSDRRIASVAWSTVEDAIYRVPRMTGRRGRGLRGGSYTVIRTAKRTTITYRSARFSNDVAVSGRAVLDGATQALDARVTVDGPGARDGTLSFDGVLFDPTHPNARVRGTIGAREVALLVPVN